MREPSLPPELEEDPQAAATQLWQEVHTRCVQPCRLRPVLLCTYCGSYCTSYCAKQCMSICTPHVTYLTSCVGYQRFHKVHQAHKCMHMGCMMNCDRWVTHSLCYLNRLQILNPEQTPNPTGVVRAGRILVIIDMQHDDAG